MLRPANLKNSDWKFHSTNQQWRGDAKAKVTSSGWSMLWSVSIWSQPLQKQHSSTSWSSSEVKSDLITKILWRTAEKTWVMDETWRFLSFARPFWKVDVMRCSNNSYGLTFSKNMFHVYSSPEKYWSSQYNWNTKLDHYFCQIEETHVMGNNCCHETQDCS